VSLQDKLEQMSDRADAAGRVAFDKRSRELAKLIAAVLKDGTWGDLSAKTERELKEAVNATKEAVTVLDAAETVHEKVLRAKNASVHDLRLKRDLRADHEQIADFFDNMANERGCVYVAWCMKPERFLYVGKAGSADRLKNLAGHGKLANAMANATQLSLIFPSQSTDNTLLEVEASVVALVIHSTGRPPENNEMEEGVPICEGGKALNRLAAFLKKVGRDIYTEQVP
jgi:hypothetical protein